MSRTSIQELGAFGQSAWLDYIGRSLILSGKLKELLELGLLGMTSNPTIFDKAISGSNDYDEDIHKAHAAGKSTFKIYDELTISDVQAAADIFLPVYEKTNGQDGYVSLEINPKLAYETEATIAEGKRLRQKVNRPNVMYKVPSTKPGLKAIEELIALGINVNITLIFALEQYVETAYAYIRGIKRLLQNDGEAAKVRSVASVFVSRVDTLVDKLLDELIAKEQDHDRKIQLLHLKGKAAVANSQLIYAKHLEIFSSAEFMQLHHKGAQYQRLLWGSTGAKNPAYSDIKYITGLIGKNTVNTMPEQTLEAFLDHGEVKEALTSDEVSNAQQVINELRSLGIDMDEVCAQLLNDGVIAFEKSFDSLLASIEEKAVITYAK